MPSRSFFTSSARSRVPVRAPMPGRPCRRPPLVAMWPHLHRPATQRCVLHHDACLWPTDERRGPPQPRQSTFSTAASEPHMAGLHRASFGQTTATNSFLIDPRCSPALFPTSSATAVPQCRSPEKPLCRRHRRPWSRPSPSKRSTSNDSRWASPSIPPLLWPGTATVWPTYKCRRGKDPSSSSPFFRGPWCKFHGPLSNAF